MDYIMFSIFYIVSGEIHMHLPQKYIMDEE